MVSIDRGCELTCFDLRQRVSLSTSFDFPSKSSGRYHTVQLSSLLTPQRGLLKIPIHSGRVSKTTNCRLAINSKVNVCVNRSGGLVV